MDTIDPRMQIYSRISTNEAINPPPPPNEIVQSCKRFGKEHGKDEDEPLELAVNKGKLFPSLAVSPMITRGNTNMTRLILYNLC